MTFYEFDRPFDDEETGLTSYIVHDDLTHPRDRFD